MNDNKSLLVGTWTLAMILVTAVSFRQTSALPHPSRIIKTCIVWTVLGVISEGSAKFAGALGIGLLVPLYFVVSGSGGTGSIQNPGTGVNAPSGANSQSGVTQN